MAKRPRPRLTLVPPERPSQDGQSSAHEARPAGRGRPFAPGNKIGAAGRPKGSRHRAYEVLEAVGEANSTGILNVLVEAALSGDMTAIKIIMDRMWPAPKGRLVPLPLPPIHNLDDLAKAHMAVTRALAEAQITVDEAAAVITVLDHRRKLIETADLEQRLIALERKAK